MSPGDQQEYRPRVLDLLIRQRLGSAGVVLIEGPKACGKTFSAEQVTSSQLYLDIDYAAQEALKIDPGLVLGGDPPQLIDEWQVDATRVWNWVRSEANRRGVPGQFVLTGSAVPDDDAQRHTGAGRFARLTMRPMSLFESGESTGEMSLAALLAGARPTARPSSLQVSDLADLVVRGGWPLNLRMSVAAAAQANIDYLRTISEVDISRVDQTRRDPERAARLFQALARNVAMEQKVAKLAREAGGDDELLARSTVYELLGAMRRLMVIEELPPWSTHLRSRATLRTASRTHFVDPSLAAAALRASPASLLADLNTLGLLFESLVVRDSRIYSEPLAAGVRHYRDSDDLEVDLIVQTPNAWGAFEVKLGAGQVDAAAESLLKFAAKVDTQKVGVPAVLAVVTGGGYGYTRPDGVVVVPVGAFGP
jgi:predicted AAA+ superfamily ATPase